MFFPDSYPSIETHLSLETDSVLTSPIPSQPKKLNFGSPAPSFKSSDGEIFTFHSFDKQTKKIHLQGSYDLYVGAYGSEEFDDQENESLLTLYEQEMAKLKPEQPQKKKKIKITQTY